MRAVLLLAALAASHPPAPALDATPSPRDSYALAYDSARDLVVLFGGSDPDYQRLGDTWLWDGEA